MQDYQKLFAEKINKLLPCLSEMADRIFDHPEIGNEEHYASELLTDFLKEHGFQVEKGIAGMQTAFRAVWECGNGGPSIGLLCEYDALEKIGHACGHHAQGPCILGTAVALKEILHDIAFKIVVYGTPAEETAAGKITMLEYGCFQDIDVAFMMHLAPDTCVDVKSMAMDCFDVTYYGKASQAAIYPESGRSALDALLLSFNAIEFLREHIPTDVRMHYTVTDAGGPANVVPARAVGSYIMRSYDGNHLSQVVQRFQNIVRGAALMTDTTVDVRHTSHMESKIPVIALNDLLMEKAKLIDAPSIAPPREKTGSTDFANVINRVPGSCIRVHFVPHGTSPHSQEFLDAGKSQAAHDAISIGANILSLASIDLITNPALMNQVKEEFKANCIEAQQEI